MPGIREIHRNTADHGAGADDSNRFDLRGATSLRGRVCCPPSARQKKDVVAAPGLAVLLALRTTWFAATMPSSKGRVDRSLIASNEELGSGANRLLFSLASGVRRVEESRQAV